MNTNAKIDELISTCTSKSRTYSDRFGNRIETHFDKYKFAELIVQECADYFGREGEGRFEVDGNWISKTIKQHFGMLK
jgi:hypothetical protein